MKRCLCGGSLKYTSLRNPSNVGYLCNKCGDFYQKKPKLSKHALTQIWKRRIEQTMATEKDRLQAYMIGGLATDADKARLRELIEAELSGGAVSEASATPVPIATPTVSSPVEEGEKIVITLSNVKKFKEGAEYSITKEGLFKSRLVYYFEPNTDKPQMWFVFESDDAKVKPANRGVFVGEYGAGSGILRTLLDSLHIPFTLDETTDNVSIEMPKLPLACWAEWSKDSKAIGGVKISGLKPGDAKIEQAL